MELLLHFSDELFGVLDQGQSPGTPRRQVNLTAFVGEDETRIRRGPLGNELAHDRVDRTLGVGLEVLDANAEVRKRDVHEPCLETVEVRDADVDGLGLPAVEVAEDAFGDHSAVETLEEAGICHLSFSLPRGTTYSFLLLFIGESISDGNALFAANRVGVVVGSEGVLQKIREAVGEDDPGATLGAFEALVDQLVDVVAELGLDLSSRSHVPSGLCEAEGVDGRSGHLLIPLSRLPWDD